ncbi:hypothetical protein RT97_30985 [Variovorax paradoxus]|uniref:Uncharacterized protein n=1 Tax=Variovorax paradoxus TaxID=34073 RepID=A0A0D0JR65_VARPD|nr:hypothetical protein [Variovorax paradoxus]KIQ16292.1 hypothetical protein RT97_30985 [Variovorax paradoxus]
MMRICKSPGLAAASIAVLFAAASLQTHEATATTLAPRKSNDSGVSVNYSIDATSQLQRVTPVVLQFEGVTDAKGAAVRLSTDPGLSIQGHRTLALPAGKKTTATVLLVSESKGLSYLHVFVTQGSGVSAISVPIQTGSTAAALKPSGEFKRNARGDKIISMPAK